MPKRTLAPEDAATDAPPPKKKKGFWKKLWDNGGKHVAIAAGTVAGAYALGKGAQHLTKTYKAAQNRRYVLQMDDLSHLDREMHPSPSFTSRLRDWMGRNPRDGPGEVLFEAPDAEPAYAGARKGAGHVEPGEPLRKRKLQAGPAARRPGAAVETRPAPPPKDPMAGVLPGYRGRPPRHLRFAPFQPDWRPHEQILAEPARGRPRRWFFRDAGKHLQIKRDDLRADPVTGYVRGDGLLEDQRAARRRRYDRAWEGIPALDTVVEGRGPS